MITVAVTLLTSHDFPNCLFSPFSTFSCEDFDLLIKKEGFKFQYEAYIATEEDRH